MLCLNPELSEEKIASLLQPFQSLPTPPSQAIRTSCTSPQPSVSSVPREDESD